VFCEDLSVRSIAAARDAFQNGDLRARLARHHDDVDGAFWGWNRAWLDPDFRRWNIEDYLPRIDVPVLAVQGVDDHYGTLAQVRVVEEECYCPVETLVLEGVGHAPHREKSAETLGAIAEFADQIFRVHHEGIENAA